MLNLDRGLWAAEAGNRLSPHNKLVVVIVDRGRALSCGPRVDLMPALENHSTISEAGKRLEWRMYSCLNRFWTVSLSATD